MIICLPESAHIWGARCLRATGEPPNFSSRGGSFQVSPYDEKLSKLEAFSCARWGLPPSPDLFRSSVQVALFECAHCFVCFAHLPVCFVGGDQSVWRCMLRELNKGVTETQARQCTPLPMHFCGTPSSRIDSCMLLCFRWKSVSSEQERASPVHRLVLGRSLAVENTSLVSPNKLHFSAGHKSHYQFRRGNEFTHINNTICFLRGGGHQWGGLGGWGGGYEPGEGINSPRFPIPATAATRYMILY